MPSIDFTVESDIDLTTRVQQLSAMFDCPAQQKCAIAFKGELPIEDFEFTSQVHYMGTVYCTKAAWPIMRASHRSKPTGTAPGSAA